jgi:hypothetical protein
VVPDEAPRGTGKVRVVEKNEEAVEDGMADAWVEFKAVKAKVCARVLGSGDLFGTRGS